MTLQKEWLQVPLHCPLGAKYLHHFDFSTNLCRLEVWEEFVKFFFGNMLGSDFSSMEKNIRNDKNVQIVISLSSQSIADLLYQMSIKISALGYHVFRKIYDSQYRSSIFVFLYYCKSRACN